MGIRGIEVVPVSVTFKLWRQYLVVFIILTSKTGVEEGV